MRKVLRWSEIFFLVVGFLCLGWVGMTYFQSYLYQSYDNYALNQELKGRIPSIGGYIDDLTSGKRGADESPTMEENPPSSPAPRYRPQTRELIGKIEIPRLQLSAVVREGVDTKTLSRAVGHVPETALPGMPGNVAVAAHRDTFFRPVRGIKKGDLIRMVTPEGTYEYEVENTRIVMPSNVEVLRPTAEPTMTLVTCYPFNYVGAAPKRFIVRARQIEREASNSQPAGAAHKTL